jgi:putative membrane protein
LRGWYQGKTAGAVAQFQTHCGDAFFAAPPNDKWKPDERLSSLPMFTKQKSTSTRGKQSLIKGFIAGAIGGLAGAAAKAAGEAVYPPRTIGQIPAPAVLLNRMSDRPLSEREEEVSVQAIHWSFGALVGGVYGAVAEFQPAVTGRLGTNFGLTLCGITHASTLPLMGLTEKPEDQPMREHASELVTHAIYGITTEIVRRLARKAL